MSFTIGIDYGTNSVRTVIVDCRNGHELGTSLVEYPSGSQGILLDPTDHHFARQHPGDYLFCLEKSVKSALLDAVKVDKFSPDKIIGIGIGTTGSSPIPVNERNVPISLQKQWKEHLAAQCWLWKDHTSYREAAYITELAGQHRPRYISKCGNIYSAEWFWAKILHCLRTAPEVFTAAYSWVELSDFIPAVLAGEHDPLKIKRGICAAGHKALYCDEWGGLPDKEFLAMLDPRLAELRDRLYEKAYDATEPAGKLCAEWAAKLGLPEDISIAIGQFDVHYGAIGSGIQEGVLVKAIGTSTCDCCIISDKKDVPDIPGICGIVKGSILPGYYGIEAGQSAVGDIFKWWVEVVCNERSHAHFITEVEHQKPGQSGLLALDWNNGNRTILIDSMLSGLLLGQTLHTTQAEIYRALIEATAFGARAIIERIQEYGVPVKYIVCCGGIVEKNSFLLQIYADVTGCIMQVANSTQACALGAAIAAAVIAGAERGGHSDFPTAQKVMTSIKPNNWIPNCENKKIYDRIYQLYRQLHDAFGGINKSSDLSNVMKELIQIKKSNT